MASENPEHPEVVEVPSSDDESDGEVDKDEESDMPFIEKDDLKADKVPRKSKFVQGKPGTPSVLQVMPELFTRNAKQQLYQALTASGTFDHPVRALADESTEEGRKERQAEDEYLAQLTATLRAETPNWNNSTARALAECAKVSEEEVPLSFAKALKNPQKPRHWRMHGPAIDELVFWNYYVFFLHKEFGGVEKWTAKVETVMWKAHGLAYKAFREKKAQQEEERRLKKLADRTMRKGKRKAPPVAPPSATVQVAEEASTPKNVACAATVGAPGTTVEVESAASTPKNVARAAMVVTGILDAESDDTAAVRDHSKRNLNPGVASGGRGRSKITDTNHAKIKEYLEECLAEKKKINTDYIEFLSTKMD
jgi:hypothetical protein